MNFEKLERAIYGIELALDELEDTVEVGTVLGYTIDYWAAKHDVPVKDIVTMYERTSKAFVSVRDKLGKPEI